MVILLLSFIFHCLSVEEFRWRVYPQNSPSRPLRQRVYEIVPEKEWGMHVWFFIEHLSRADLSIAYVEESGWTNERALYFRIGSNPRVGLNSSIHRPVYSRISVWNHDKSIMLANSSNLTTIYWDFRFSNFNFTVDMQRGSRTGEIVIIPKPTSDFDAELMKQVRVMRYTIMTSDLATSDSTYMTGDDVVSSSNSFELRHVFWEPKVMYWRVQAHSGWDLVYPGEGFDSTIMRFFATVCCSEVSGCPSVDPSFVSAGHSVFTLDPCIPGDKQLYIRNDDVYIVEGSPVFPRIRLNHGEYFLIDVPRELQLETRQNPTVGVPFYSAENETSDIDHIGYTMYRIEKLSGVWTNLPLIFSFHDGIVLDGRKYSVFVKHHNPESEWQELKVTPFVIPENPNPPPRRLWTGITVGSMEYYGSYSFYGLNLVPLHGYYATDLSEYDWATPTARETVWEDDCPGCGLEFAPASSLFSRSNHELEMPSLITEVLKVTSITESLLPSHVPDRPSELTKWQNAVDFFNSYGVTDIAYDGYFYKRQLEVFGSFLAYTKPRMVLFDVEGFGPSDLIFPHVSDGANFNARRMSGESDEDLYQRVVDEILGGTMDVVKQNSPQTEIVWYATRCWRPPPGRGYRIGTWDDYDRAGYICSPQLYQTIKHPWLVARRIRASKQGCCCKNCDQQSWSSPSSANKRHMIPTTTNGVYGEFPSRYMLDWLIQLFTNGGTGFAMYRQCLVDDARDLVYLAEGMRIFGAPLIEDIIMDGWLAYQKVHLLTENIEVGCIESFNSSHTNVITAGTLSVLFGVSHFWTSPTGIPASFRYPWRVNATGFIVLDLRLNITIYDHLSDGNSSSNSNPKIFYDGGNLTFQYEKPEDVLPHVYLLYFPTPSDEIPPNDKKNKTGLVITLIIIFFVLNTLILVIVIVFLCYCALRRNKKRLESEMGVKIKMSDHTSQ